MPRYCDDCDVLDGTDVRKGIDADVVEVHYELVDCYVSDGHETVLCVLPVSQCLITIIYMMSLTASISGMSLMFMTALITVMFVVAFITVMFVMTLITVMYVKALTTVMFVMALITVTFVMSL